MKQQSEIANVRKFFISRGCFNVATLINFLATPAGCRLTLVGTQDVRTVDVLCSALLTKDCAERVWRYGKIAIGGGETDFMPLAWLQQCTTFWDTLSSTAQRNFDRACGDFTLKYRMQQPYKKQLTWEAYYEEG